MSEPAPLPDLFTADASCAQVLEHVRTLRSRATDFDIKIATSDDPRPRTADLDLFERTLEDGSLLRAMVRMRVGEDSVVDSLLRTASGFRVVRFHPNDGSGATPSS